MFTLAPSFGGCIKDTLAILHYDLHRFYTWHSGLTFNGVVAALQEAYVVCS